MPKKIDCVDEGKCGAGDSDAGGGAEIDAAGFSDGADEFLAVVPDVVFHGSVVALSIFVGAVTGIRERPIADEEITSTAPRSTRFASANMRRPRENVEL